MTDCQKTPWLWNFLGTALVLKGFATRVLSSTVTSTFFYWVTTQCNVFCLCPSPHISVPHWYLSEEGFSVTLYTVIFFDTVPRGALIHSAYIIAYISIRHTSSNILIILIFRLLWHHSLITAQNDGSLNDKYCIRDNVVS